MDLKKKQHIKRIYDAAFSADRAWNDWFFNSVYSDDEALLLAPGGNPVSCLFLQHYRFGYQGANLGLAYISGAATAPDARRKGYMRQLLTDALQTAYGRGDAFAALIPASDRLYFYYDKFGFATVVYADIERYTSVHTFALAEGYNSVEPTYGAFRTLELKRNATVLHSESDFRNILSDIDHDGGVYVCIDNPDGVPAAMAFATATDTEIHVKDLLGDDPAATEMALACVKASFDDLNLPMAVWHVPTGRKASLRSRGMMRIVNVGAVLTALAANNPRVEQVIRVTDNIIPANNGTYILHKGCCTTVDTTIRQLTLDVTVDVLTKIIFSAEKTGRIFDLPTGHPQLALMLD